MFTRDILRNIEFNPRNLHRTPPPLSVSASNCQDRYHNSTKLLILATATTAKITVLGFYR